MANHNQQVTHIYNLEQYEANRIQIAKMKEWLRAYESQNEIGFEGYKSLQEDLERKIRDGEEARRRLQALQPQPSLKSGGSISNSTYQSFSTFVPLQQTRLPTTATIEEIDSVSPKPPLPSNARQTRDPASPLHTYAQGAANSSGSTRSPYYRDHQGSNPQWTTSQSSQQPITSSSGQNNGYNPSQSAPSSNGMPSTSRGMYINVDSRTPVIQMSSPAIHMQRSVSSQNRSSSTTDDIPSLQAQNVGTPVEQQKLHLACEEIYRTIESYPFKDIVSYMVRAFRSREDGTLETGLVQRIAEHLKPFSSHTARGILAYVYKRCERDAASRTTSAHTQVPPRLSDSLAVERPQAPTQPSYSFNVDNLESHNSTPHSIVKTTSTGADDPSQRIASSIPPTDPVTNASQLLNPPDPSTIRTVSFLPPADQPRITNTQASALANTLGTNQPPQARMKTDATATPTLKMKLQGILAELHQAKTNQEVAYIMLTIYNATVTDHKPSDSLAVSIWDSLKHYPASAVQIALTDILEQLKRFAPGIDIPKRGTMQSIDTTVTSKGAGISTDSSLTSTVNGKESSSSDLVDKQSTNSLSGALDMLKQPSQSSTKATSQLTSNIHVIPSKPFIPHQPANVPPQTTAYDFNRPSSRSPFVYDYRSFMSHAPSTSGMSSNLATSPIQQRISKPVPVSVPNTAQTNPTEAIETSSELRTEQATVVGFSASPVGTSRRMPVQADKSRLARDILKELGMPSGTMPALMTNEEAKNKMRSEKKQWKEEIWALADADAAKKDMLQTSPGLVQLVSQPHSHLPDSQTFSSSPQSNQILPFPDVSSGTKVVTVFPPISNCNGDPMPRWNGHVGPEVALAHPVEQQIDTQQLRATRVALANLRRVKQDLERVSGNERYKSQDVPTQTLAKKSIPLHSAISRSSIQPVDVSSSIGAAKEVRLSNQDAVMTDSQASISPSQLVIRNQNPPSNAAVRDRWKSLRRADPLFLVSHSESEEAAVVMPKTKQQTNMGTAKSTSFGHVAQVVDSNLSLVKDRPRRIRSQTNVGPSDQSSAVVNYTESHDAEGSQRRLKRKRFWIEVPPLPKWAKKSAKTSKRRDVWEEVEETDPETDSDTEERGADEQRALDESFTRLIPSHCRWHDCRRVPNSTHTLCKHLVAHINESEEYNGFRCLWRDCSKRYTRRDKLEHHVLSSHARKEISCAYQACSEIFYSARHLVNHNLMQHRDDQLKRSVLPMTFSGGPPLQSLPSSLPSYQTVDIPVVQASISADWHAKLGPWVLRQMYGPINTKGLRYNAATSLRTSLRPKITDDPSQSEGAQALLPEIRSLRPEYEFLDSKRSGNRGYASLACEKVTDDCADGLILAWGEQKDVARAGDIDEAGAETVKSDDELLLQS